MKSDNCYKSQFYIRQVKLAQKLKEIDNDAGEYFETLQNKRLGYAKFVAEYHKPVVSMKKKLELINLIEDRKHPVKRK